MTFDLSPVQIIGRMAFRGPSFNQVSRSRDHLLIS